MNILIAGGTGFIGSILTKHFIGLGYVVYVLTRRVENLKTQDSIVYLNDLTDQKLCFDVIINLSGEPLNKNRWNPVVKKRIYQSRIESTRKIVDYIQTAKIKPKVLISGSAIGYYGNSLDITFSEDSMPADSSFIHKICADWEQAAMKASQYGIRVCVIRTGIVLGRNHGILAEMVPPFKLGLGAKLGDGQQWMSWIHIEDLVKAFDFFILNSDLSGPFNLTAPYAVTSDQFATELAKQLKRPLFIRLPRFIVKMIFGEMGEALMLNGQKVLPSKLINAGFKFNFQTIQDALSNIFNSKQVN